MTYKFLQVLLRQFIITFGSENFHCFRFAPDPAVWSKLWGASRTWTLWKKGNYVWHETQLRPVSSEMLADKYYGLECGRTTTTEESSKFYFRTKNSLTPHSTGRRWYGFAVDICETWAKRKSRRRSENVVCKNVFVSQFNNEHDARRGSFCDALYPRDVLAGNWVATERCCFSKGLMKGRETMLTCDCALWWNIKQALIPWGGGKRPIVPAESSWHNSLEGFVEEI